MDKLFGTKYLEGIKSTFLVIARLKYKTEAGSIYSIPCQFNLASRKKEGICFEVQGLLLKIENQQNKRQSSSSSLSCFLIF